MKLITISLVLLAGSASANQFAHSWAPETSKRFMTSCQKTGTEAQCMCALNKLKARYSQEEAFKVDFAVQGGESMPQGIADIRDQCEKI